MRILFIYPIPPPQLQIRRYQMGLGYISALLKRHGHKTRLYAPYRYEEGTITHNIDSFKPDLIGLSLTTNQVELASQIMDYIKASYGLPLVIGGIHPTVMPEDCISRDGVIAICRGEGEEAMLELVTARTAGKDCTGIKNLWLKKDGRIFKNYLRPLLEDLDKLPFPDRELFDYQRLLNDYPQVELMAGRGCPYKCTYCVNPFLNRLAAEGRYIRQRNVENILNELGEITARYNHIETVLFHDDTFTLDRLWLREFSLRYRERFKIPFWCNTRVDAIDKEKLGWLKEAGCLQIHLGIETGNDFISRSILNRNLGRTQIMASCRQAKEMGFKLAVFNMVGLPYETVASIKETIQINREIGPDSIFCSIFYPYPGTVLYDLCQKKGWLSPRQVSSFFESVSVLDQPSIRPEEVAYYHEIFKGLVLYPKFGPAIQAMARLKIWRGHSLYGLFQKLVWFLTVTISSNLSPAVKSFIKGHIRKVRQICH